MGYPYLHKLFSNCVPKPSECNTQPCCEEEKECKYTGVPLACSDVDLTLPINDIIQYLDNQICLLQDQVNILTGELEECNNSPTTTTTTTVVVEETTTTTTTIGVIEETTTTTTTTEFIEETTTTSTTTILEETTTTTSTTLESSTTTTTTIQETTTTTTTVLPEETTTTTTSLWNTSCIEYEASGGISGGEVNYVDCNGREQMVFVNDGVLFPFCAFEGSVFVMSGTVVVAIIGPC